jgi:Astacin (Peptidase family M12A)
MPATTPEFLHGEFRSSRRSAFTMLNRRTVDPTLVRYSPVGDEAIFEGDIVLGSVKAAESAFLEYLIQESASIPDETASEALRPALRKLKGIAAERRLARWVRHVSAFDPVSLDVPAHVQEVMAIARTVPQEADAPLEAVARTGSRYRWPGRTIPYEVDASLPVPERVDGAIDHWQLNTPIRFVKRTNEANYVSFEPGGGCSSEVGMQGGPQVITLGAECTQGNVIHEIGHTVGLWHEQSREDRGDYIEIDVTNIDPDYIHNFDQHINDGDDIGAYDYGSIMHYPPDAFAMDPSRPTIRTKNGAKVGQRKALSALDAAAVKFLYP